MNKSQNGQIGLVVLLIAAVLLTLGIGIASQSILETNTATQESNTSKVFNLTERAIEEALKNLNSDIDEYDGVQVNVDPKANIYTADVLQGDSAQLDLTGSNSLILHWTDTNDCITTAAIVVTTIGGANGSSLERYAYDKPNCRTGAEENGFIKAPDVTCDGTTCAATISSVGQLLARIKVLYANTNLTADIIGGNAIQSYIVQAEGTDAESGETRAIKAVRSMPAVPSIFDYALFSGSGAINQ